MGWSSRVSDVQPQPCDRLASGGFLGLWATQWTTAVNDNAFRWWVVGIAKDLRPPEEHPALLTGALALFVLPYLFLAAPAGYLADRFPKRTVVMVGKWVEALALAAGVGAVYVESWWGLFGVVAILGCQSALFAPAKMGLLPEMMSASRLSAANGWFGLSTVTATLAGMGLGGLLADLTHPHGSQHLELAAGVFACFSIGGLFAAIAITRHPAADPRRAFPWRPIQETIRDLGMLRARPSLAFATAGIVLFWGLAGFAQLNLDQFAFETGGFHESERTPLLVSLVLGVGIGCVLAGALSRGRIELGLLAPSLGLLGVCAALLAQVQGDLFHLPGAEEAVGWEWWSLHGRLFGSMALLLVMGISAGVFDVPLAAYLQHRSPASQRGSLLSAANFLIYGGILVSALGFTLLRWPVHDGARWRIFEGLPELSPIAQREVDLEAQKFRAVWNEVGDPPEIRQWLERALPEEQHYHRMAALLWEEIGLRRRDGQTPLPIDYEALARDDVQRRVIKEVFRQSQRLPLFSARHLFLVMAVVTLPIAVAIAWWLPHATLRFWLGMLLRRLGTIDSSDEPSLPEEALVLVTDRSRWLDRWGIRILVGRPLTEVFFEPAANSRAPRRGERGVIRIAGGPAGRQMGLALARRTLLHGGTLLVHAKSQEETPGEAFPEEAVKLIEGIRIRCVPICVVEPLPETGFRWSTLVPRWLRRRRFRFGDPAPLEPAVPAEFHRRIQALRN